MLPVSPARRRGTARTAPSPRPCSTSWGQYSCPAFPCLIWPSPPISRNMSLVSWEITGTLPIAGRSWIPRTATCTRTTATCWWAACHKYRSVILERVSCSHPTIPLMCPNLLLIFGAINKLWQRESYAINKDALKLKILIFPIWNNWLLNLVN